MDKKATRLIVVVVDSDGGHDAAISVLFVVVVVFAFALAFVLVFEELRISRIAEVIT